MAKKYLSLFDGMSCLQIALKSMGIEVDEYYASEIDKHAIAQTQLNFPKTKQLGSVTEWKTWDLDWSQIGFLAAGSPCQGFSFAGKQLAFNDPRSKLFFVFIDILNHIRKFNPDVIFLLENVKMKAEHEAIITQYVGINPIEINSALLSAQNRVRLYWTNIGVVKQGLFDEFYPGIPQPKDKGILLKDILETNVPEKYYLSDKMLQYFSKRAANFNQGKVNVRDEEGKASTLTASMSSCDISDNFIKVDTKLQIAENQDKSSCFTAGGNSGGLHSDMDLICVASRGRNPENPKSRKVGLPTEQHLEARNDGKTNCLTSVQKDNLILEISEATKKGFVEIESGECFDFRNPNSKTRRGRKMEDKSNCLMANKTTFMHYSKDYRLRRLTPTECARLQTIPVWYEWKCSDTQQYRMLGNGWTVEPIIHILSYANL